MTYENFLQTLHEEILPRNLPILLQALWHDYKGDWHAAHEIAQMKEGTYEYDRLHAYLHRKEGDSWNANYWYRRCGEQMREITLSEEWNDLAHKFSAKY